jgi:predicted Zn-dependent protease
VVVVDKIVKYAEREGAQEAEVVCEDSQYTHVKFELGEPKQTFLGKTTEYALRVVVDSALGFSYFTGDWKKAVQEAITLARTREKDEKWSQFPSDRPVKSLNLFNDSVKDVSIDRVISDMQETSTGIKDEHIVASNIDCQVGHSHIEIANSSGINKKDSRSFANLRVLCRAADTDYGMGYAYGFSLEYDIDMYQKGQIAKEKALNQLGKQKTESGVYPVILSPKVFSSLLVCAVMPSFLGHNKVEGRSSLVKGQSVAADHITVTENPLVEAPPGREFDDEGSPAQKVDVIHTGHVENFLYDTYYGDTTSNGIRYSRYRGRILRDPPRPCATSLEVFGDMSALDDMISGIDQGLLVMEETNSHASKPQSGLFSIAVSSGFMIKNGEIGSPVKRCMVSGLAFEDLLPNTQKISKEQELHRSFVYPTFVQTGYALVDSLQVTA